MGAMSGGVGSPPRRLRRPLPLLTPSAAGFSSLPPPPATTGDDDGSHPAASSPRRRNDDDDDGADAAARLDVGAVDGGEPWQDGEAGGGRCVIFLFC